MNKEELEKEATEYAQKLGAKDFIAKPKEIVAYFGYLAGAEPREKRIAELEYQLTHRNCVDCSNHSSNLRMRNLALEKENAELKGIKDVATLIRANNDTVTTLMQLNNMLVSKTQQLTKAKEIIKLLLHALKNEGSDYTFALENTHPVLAEAEQFLNEVEK